MKKKLITLCVFVVAAIILAACYFPKPLVRNVRGSDVISIMYRAESWDELRYFYPTQDVPSINEEELLKMLSQSNAIVEVLAATATDGIPTDEITLLLSISEGNKIKHITLGEYNQMSVQGSFVKYRILDPASVTNQLLGFLKIAEHSSFSTSTS